NATPMTAASRATAASTRSRLSGLRTGRPSAGSPAGLGVATVGVESRQDAVLHRSTEQIDLGRRGASDLDVLDADAVEVLPRGRVADPELLGGELQGKTRRVQVQDLPFATPQLCLGEVA